MSVSPEAPSHEEFLKQVAELNKQEKGKSDSNNGNGVSSMTPEEAAVRLEEISNMQPDQLTRHLDEIVTLQGIVSKEEKSIEADKEESPFQLEPESLPL